jgi:hypothetical protein
MDSFEKLTGFRETDYYSTRAKLAVEGRRLRSRINGASYSIGELEVISLQALREKAASAGRTPGRLKVSVVTGDVRRMHQLRENAGALFQVASQFNLLEMVGPFGDTRARRNPLQGRSHPRPRVRYRRRRSHDLPQLFRARWRQPRPDREAPDRHVSEARGGTERRFGDANQRLVEDAERLRAVHARRPRRHYRLPRHTGFRSDRHRWREVVHRRAP